QTCALPIYSLVEYRIAADGRHVFERYSASAVFASIAAALQLEAPAETGGPLLQLSRRAFQAYIAVVDCQREWTLRSLLQRTPREVPVLTASAAVAALGR